MTEAAGLQTEAIGAISPPIDEPAPMLESLINKLVAIEMSLSQHHGDFVLFVLLAQKEAPGGWDLIVSARWFSSRRSALELVASRLQQELAVEEILIVSKVVVLEPDTPFVAKINSAIKTEHSIIHLSNCHIYGIDIADMYLITSMPRPVG